MKFDVLVKQTHFLLSMYYGKTCFGRAALFHLRSLQRSEMNNKELKGDRTNF